MVRHAYLVKELEKWGVVRGRIPLLYGHAFEAQVGTYTLYWRSNEDGEVVTGRYSPTSGINGPSQRLTSVRSFIRIALTIPREIPINPDQSLAVSIRAGPYPKVYISLFNNPVDNEGWYEEYQDKDLLRVALEFMRTGEQNPLFDRLEELGGKVGQLVNFLRSL